MFAISKIRKISEIDFGSGCVWLWPDDTFRQANDVLNAFKRDPYYGLKIAYKNPTVLTICLFRNSDGTFTHHWTALHIVACLGNLQVMQELIALAKRNGWDVLNVTDENGLLPRDVATGLCAEYFKSPESSIALPEKVRPSFWKCVFPWMKK
jgi:hypothetical protein